MFGGEVAFAIRTPPRVVGPDAMFHAHLFPLHLDFDDLAAALDALDRSPAQAEARRVLEDRRLEPRARFVAREERYQHAGPVLLHRDGAPPHVERTGGAQGRERDADLLAGHVVELQFAQERLGACGARGIHRSGAGAELHAAEIRRPVLRIARSRAVADALGPELCRRREALRQFSEQRGTRRGQSLSPAAVDELAAAQELRDRRRGHRHLAVRALDHARADERCAGEDARDPEALQRQRRATHIHQRVDGADLVEVDLLGTAPVHAAFGDRDPPQHRERALLRRGRKRRSAHQALQVLVTPVWHRTALVRLHVEVLAREIPAPGGGQLEPATAGHERPDRALEFGKCETRVPEIQQGRQKHVPGQSAERLHVQFAHRNARLADGVHTRLS